MKTLNEFAVEYAKSNRSTCKGCELKIEKVSALFHLDIEKLRMCVSAIISSDLSF